MLLALLAMASAAPNMCKVEGDFVASVNVSGSSCQMISDFLLQNIHASPSPESWDDVTCSDIAASTLESDEGDGNPQSMVSTLLFVYSSSCCGGTAKVRCLDDSNMCKNSSDLQPGQDSDHESCPWISRDLLTKIPGNKLTWSNMTCQEFDSATVVGDNIKLGMYVQFYASCCGGAANVRCLDDSNMCINPSDYREDAASGVTDDESGSDVTCSHASRELLSQIDRPRWSAALCYDLQKEIQGPDSQPTTAQALLASSLGANCCGSASNARNATAGCIATSRTFVYHGCFDRMAGGNAPGNSGESQVTSVTSLDQCARKCKAKKQPLMGMTNIDCPRAAGTFDCHCGATLPTQKLSDDSCLPCAPVAPESQSKCGACGGKWSIYSSESKIDNPQPTPQPVALRCYTAHVPTPSKGMCTTEAAREIKVCAPSQALADQLASSEHTRGALENVTEASCGRDIASLCAGLQGQASAPTQEGCCSRLEPLRRPVVTGWTNCQGDDDCLGLPYDAGAVYADVCSGGTCMPALPHSVCCDWCQAQLRALCGIPSGDAQSMLYLEYCQSDEHVCDDAPACWGRFPSLLTTSSTSTTPPSTTPAPVLPPAPEGIMKLSLTGLTKAEFNPYLESHFLKVVSSVAGVPESLLSVQVTNRRRSDRATSADKNGILHAPRGRSTPQPLSPSAPWMPGSGKRQGAVLEMDLKVRAVSMSRAINTLKVIEESIVSGIFLQAMNNGIPVTAIQIRGVSTAQVAGKDGGDVALNEVPKLFECHETCQTCILPGRDGCVLCKDGYAFWQPPGRVLEGELENGQCVGKWNNAMMLVWAFCPLVGLLLVGVCIWAAFNGLDLAIDLGKRRHRRRQVRWVPVDTDPEHLDVDGLPQASGGVVDGKGGAMAKGNAAPTKK